MAASQQGFAEARRPLAEKYLRGSGLEIGALHMPLPVLSSVEVTFVDRLGVEELRRHYPELAGQPLVPVDVVDDGERLDEFEDDSQDFVIANHFLEHTEDPIGALANQLRVLRRDGVIYLAVPDKRHTFDSARSETPLDHVLRDHREGPAWSRHDHYREWAEHVAGVDKGAVERSARELEQRGYSIHFHVWTRDGLVELLEHCRAVLKMPFTIEDVRENEHEVICIVRKG